MQQNEPSNRYHLQINGHFIAGADGPLATLLICPDSRAGTSPCAALYVPPAGDEMNKSRRMAALQARALAHSGATVALLDLRGTGDSAGDHGEATWDGWLQDVQCAWRWLSDLVFPARQILWGSRLGGLLSSTLVAAGRITPDALLLWQPVLSGKSFFNQWLRLAAAQRLTGGSGKGDTASLRASVDAGASIELGGYELNPRLISGAEGENLLSMHMRGCPVIWREISPGTSPKLSSAAETVADRWTAQGTSVDILALPGAPFWASQEIVEVPALIESTTDALVRLGFTA